LKKALRIVTLGISLALAPAGSANALVWPDVPERIERALKAPDPMTRRAAAQELHTLGRGRGAPLVLQALSDTDVEVKVAAAQSAIRLRVPQATEAVLPWLGDREARLRIAACDVARALPSPRSVPQLARALGDTDASVRAAAADALGAQNSADAVAPLLGKLDDASPAVRIQIVRALAKLGDKRAVVPLVGKVQDSVVDVRQAVVRALGELGDARAGQALVLSLRDGVTEVRIEAVHALGRLHSQDTTDSVAPLAVDRNAALRQAALSALGRIGTRDSVRALVSALGLAEDAGGGFEHTPVRDALVTAGDAAVPELSALLEGTPTPQVATSAAWVLGELHAANEAKTIISAMRRGVLPTAAALHALAGAKTRDGVPIVLEFIGNSSPTVRAEAARAAAALLDPSRPDGRAVEPLAAALRNANLTPQERATLALLLGRTGAPRAATILVGLSNAKFPALKLAAVDALGTLGPAGADDALLEKLEDEDAAMRLHAAIALGDAGSAKAREALLAKLEAGEEVDRAASLTALGGIMARVPTEGAMRRLARALELAAGPERDALLSALGRSRAPGTVAVLDGVAHGVDADDRRAVAALLPLHPRASAEPIARRALRDADASVRAQAAWAMGTLGDANDATGLAALTALANGQDVDTAVNAVGAIGRMAARAHAPQVAERTLCPFLRDGRAYVRTNALAGLAALGARCGDGASERGILEGDTNELARAAAAAVIQRGTRPSAGDESSLEHCAQTDRSGSVAERCRRKVRREPDGARASGEADHSVEVYVVPDGGNTPRPRASYALAFSDGFLRAGMADRRGGIFEPHAPAGDVTLERPSAQAR
jgi:HEAT repeat protein